MDRALNRSLMAYDRARDRQAEADLALRRAADDAPERKNHKTAKKVAERDMRRHGATVADRLQSAIRKGGCVVRR